MRRGCISLGNVKCDECQRIISYPERYLSIDEEEKSQYLCVECCLKKGYACQKVEKGEQVLTFLEE